MPRASPSSLLTSSPLEACHPSYESEAAAIRAVRTQFVRPHGFAGWLASWEMALRPSNRKRNRWAVALLDVQPQDHILEIGFGPGLAIRELARRATDGFVLGIDHSEVMVRQAAVRNRAAVEQGRVELRLGSALDLDDFSEMFDKALAVNNLGMWPEPEARLKDLRGALRRGGRVAIVSQPRCPGASAETTERVGDERARRLRDAGFIILRRETLNLRPPVAGVLAEAPLSETGSSPGEDDSAQ
jgi:SAM-dependent methyltransferase